MPNRKPAAFLFAGLALAFVEPAFAAGEIHITHAKALAGNVTPGDTRGYPVVLSEPGTYMLADNLIVPLNKTGLAITSPYVTVDLNGFTIQGGTKGLHGVYGAQHGVTIKNGTIVGFKLDGISGQGNFWIIENMRVISNGRDGIFCLASCQVQNSISSKNGVQGIGSTGGTFIGNTLIENGNYGLFAWGLAGYGNNTIMNNGGGQAGGAGLTSLNPNACSSACP